MMVRLDMHHLTAQQFASIIVTRLSAKQENARFMTETTDMMKWVFLLA
jgi:hypothetical protein